MVNLSNDLNLNKFFIDMLPNLKILKFQGIDDIYDELLLYISERCVKLESLKIFSIYNEVSVMYFPNLKKLNIVMCNSENVTTFIK